MNIKKKISKKLLLHLAFFVAIISVASLFDIYFENNPEKLVEMQAGSADDPGVQDRIYFVSQVNTVDAKTSFQKSIGRRLQVELNTRFVQKYYQLRNYQILKEKVQKQTAPLIFSYHYLVFRNYFFTVPDDEPLVS